MLKRLLRDEEAIIELYKGGALIEDLAEQYRCCPQTMRRFLIVSEIAIRLVPRKMKLEPFEAELIRLYRGGAKVVELAAHYRVSATSLRKFIRRKLGPSRSRPGQPPAVPM